MVSLHSSCHLILKSLKPVPGLRRPAIGGGSALTKLSGFRQRACGDCSEQMPSSPITTLLSSISSAVRIRLDTRVSLRPPPCGLSALAGPSRCHVRARPAEHRAVTWSKGFSSNCYDQLQTQPDRELQANVPSRRLEPDFADSRV
jgi:hypothetical protein